MLRRVFTTAGMALAATALLAGTAVTASADAQGLSDIVAFHGVAVIQTDSDGDAQASVDLMGGSGTYQFNQSLFCEAYSIQDAGLPQACTITSAGAFTNIVCGTGHVTGSGPTTITSATENASSPTYSLTFVGTIGVITGELDSTDPVVGEDSPHVAQLGGPEASPDREPFVGVVVLLPPVPPAVPDDLGDCTHTFGILGVIIAVDNATVANQIMGPGYSS